MKQWYEELFENYAIKYDQEGFTHGTIGECDFIEQEISYNKKTRILDIGCGTGRHSIELATRGYPVVGIDLSESLLNRAKEKALNKNLPLDFYQYDARKLPFVDEFDLVYIMCEGGFCLMETDEMNYQILESAAQALKSGGLFIFTALNALYPLYHSVKDLMDDNINSGKTENHSFDLMTFRESSIFNIEDDLGKKKTIHCNERYYVPSEITWLLKTLKFEKIEIFGSNLGAFSRNDSLSPDNYEMLVVAHKI
ncbi:class I SAM-dependent methyltransferase [Crocosphaera sp.]|uniref:class I SAM-dependent methyltransferase n=1 Tax=Crocosphaera sp. TaxID=2729996 RepID=UPI003F231CA1|nr:class I SAM-dependent methyltransferase [Crocosphaera sp.]